MQNNSRAHNHSSNNTHEDDHRDHGHHHDHLDHDHRDHGHDHGHGGLFHVHAPTHHMKRAFFLTMLILIVEFAGGMLSHSLALLSDAGHVLTDLGAIGLSWFALRQAQRPSNERMTYGYYRLGILAALINGLALIVITLWILWEAYNRLHHPSPVHGVWMLISAGIGLLVNLYLGLGMRDENDLNVRSVVLHMLGDAAASAGVIIAGVIIILTHVPVIDPILSVMIALLIAVGAVRIVRQTVIILMEGTPSGIDFQKVVQAIKSVSCVQDVHDVHVWSIASGRNALSCHVVLDGRITIQDSQQVLRSIEHLLVHMGISHVTVQTEDAGHPHDDKELCAAQAPKHP